MWILTGLEYLQLESKRAPDYSSSYSAVITKLKTQQPTVGIAHNPAASRPRFNGLTVYQAPVNSDVKVEVR